MVRLVSHQMTALEEAQALCQSAQALLITAGAGMGVDSGLPDFRGREGFWRAYPPYKELGFNFYDVATPDSFRVDPALGWGFYGHRLNLYRAAQPHAGFSKLREFSQALPGGCFVFTSNVDGHFQRAGFGENRIMECHGSILHQQCAQDCQGKIWEAGEDEIAVDESRMRALEPLPGCPDCPEHARPNVLMFGDWGWNPNRTLEQRARYQDWLESVIRGEYRLIILEFGAGTTIPTVRIQSEQIASLIPGSAFIRVNPREAEFGTALPQAVGLEIGALRAIEALLG